MHDRLVSRRIDALHQCFLVCIFCDVSLMGKRLPTRSENCLQFGVVSELRVRFRTSEVKLVKVWTSRKHAYIFLTPLNPTFI